MACRRKPINCAREKLMFAFHPLRTEVGRALTTNADIQLALAACRFIPWSLVERAGRQ
jgi:hypothetical protein